jgi:chromosome segregation ATPase
MTLAGKIFSILSLLLGIGFLLITAPVARNLIELQKDVEAIEFGGQDSRGVSHRSHQEIRTNAAQLDAKRVQLQFDLSRLQQTVSAEVSRNKNQIDFLQGQRTLWQDMEKAWRQSVLHWQESLKDLRSEIEARTSEKERLEQELAEFERRRSERDAQVSELQAALDEAGRKLAETLETMLNDYEKLRRLTERSSAEGARESGGVAASR